MKRGNQQGLNTITLHINTSLLNTRMMGISRVQNWMNNEWASDVTVFLKVSLVAPEDPAGRGSQWHLSWALSIVIDTQAAGPFTHHTHASIWYACSRSSSWHPLFTYSGTNCPTGLWLSDSDTRTSPAEQMQAFILRSWHFAQRAQRSPRLRTADLPLSLSPKCQSVVNHQPTMLSCTRAHGRDLSVLCGNVTWQSK